MINPAPYLRRTLFGLLNNNVAYNSTTVPVYESEGVNTAQRQIIIGEYSDSEIGNSHIFGANATQVIEVVCEEPTAVRKHADAIGELVNNLILPTPTSSTLNGADIHITVKRPSINHIIENSGEGTKIVRLILRYPLLIHHN